MNKKILFLTKYDYSGPSSRYRFYNFKDVLEEKGYKITINPFFSSFYFKNSNKIKKIINIFYSYIRRIILLISLLFKKNYDLIMIEYEVIPYFPAIFEYLLKVRGYKYTVDYDDPIFHRYDINKNILIKTLLRNKIKKVMKYANAVIVCNEYLGNYAKKYNTNLVYIPTVVKNLEKYETMTKKVLNNSTSLRIGWIGSSSTSKHLVDIIPAIENIAKKYDIELVLIGFDKKLLSVQQIENCNIRVVIWKEETEIEEIASLDIGIMPLKNNLWTRGKCGFKLIQYMSCAKPVIATKLGVNCNLIDESNGFLVETLEEWESSLTKLVKDDKLRSVFGAAGYRKIKSKYNFKNNSKIYLELIKKTISS